MCVIAHIESDDRVTTIRNERHVYPIQQSTLTTKQKKLGTSRAPFQPRDDDENMCAPSVVFRTAKHAHIRATRCSNFSLCVASSRKDSQQSCPVLQNDIMSRGYGGYAQPCERVTPRMAVAVGSRKFSRSRTSATPRIRIKRNPGVRSVKFRAFRSWRVQGGRVKAYSAV